MTQSTIHFWDMDHTLIDNDCDVSWKEFLIQKGLTAESARETIDLFWRQYIEGRLDFEKFLEFQLKEFIGKTREEIVPLTEGHFKKFVKPRIFREIPTILREIRRAKEQLCLITSTNNVVAEPVARYLGFRDVIATELEIKSGTFTGKISGTYCGGDGKIPYIERFCDQHQTDSSQCSYYGDSVTDIPVFEYIGRAVVVNPKGVLVDLAERKGWRTLTLTS